MVSTSLSNGSMLSLFLCSFPAPPISSTKSSSIPSKGNKTICWLLIIGYTLSSELLTQGSCLSGFQQKPLKISALVVN
jgi:hypothetical protein